MTSLTHQNTSVESPSALTQRTSRGLSLLVDETRNSTNDNIGNSANDTANDVPMEEKEEQRPAPSLADPGVSGTPSATGLGDSVTHSEGELVLVTNADGSVTSTASGTDTTRKRKRKVRSAEQKK